MLNLESSVSNGTKDCSAKFPYIHSLCIYIYVQQSKVVSVTYGPSNRKWSNDLFFFAATRDHIVGNTACGFGIRVENLREARFNHFLLTFFTFANYDVTSLSSQSINESKTINFDANWFYSYQRADPNFVMLTPNKEHLAEGIVWKIGRRPMFQSDVNTGNFDGIPRELRPLDTIL